MWVRSQNGDLLVDCNEFRVTEIFHGCKVVAYAIESGDYELGRFTFKKQVMEVLEFIEEVITAPRCEKEYITEHYKGNAEVKRILSRDDVVVIPKDEVSQ